jgi:hypothetical protein
MYFISIENFNINNLMVKENNHIIELLYNYDNNDMISDLILEIPWSNKNNIDNFEEIKKIRISKNNIYYDRINNINDMIFKKLEDLKNFKINKLYANYIISSETKINLIKNSRIIKQIESKDINYDLKDYYKTEFNIYFSIKIFNYDKLFAKNELITLNIKPTYFNKKYVENKLVEKVRISDYQDNQISI